MHLLSRGRGLKGWSLLLGPALCVAVWPHVGCNSQDQEPSAPNAEAGRPGEGGARQATAGSGGHTNGATFAGTAGLANAGDGQGPATGTGGATENGPPSVGGQGGEEADGSAGEGGNAGEGGERNGGGSGGAGNAGCSVHAGSEGTGAVPINVTGPGVWAAWQDGDGPWNALVKTSNAFTFRPSGTRYSVAVVCLNQGVYSGSVYNETTQIKAIAACSTSAFTSCGRGFAGTLTGTVSNVGTSQWLVVNGNASPSGYAIAPVGGSATYSVSPRNASDLAFGIAPASGQPLTNIAVRRGALTDVTQSPTTANVDFSTEGKPVTLKSVTVTGLQAGDTQAHSVLWVSEDEDQDCADNGLPVATSSTSNPDTYAALAPSLFKPQDSYSAGATGYKGGDPKNSASVTMSLGAAEDVVLPLTFTSASVSFAAPVVTTSFPAYPNARSYVFNTSCSSAASSMLWLVFTTQAWLGDCSDCQVSVPDLSAVSCWRDAWACRAGSTVTADFRAWADSGDFAQSAFLSGLKPPP